MISYMIYCISKLEDKNSVIIYYNYFNRQSEKDRRYVFNVDTLLINVLVYFY